MLAAGVDVIAFHLKAAIGDFLIHSRNQLTRANLFSWEKS